MVVCFAKFIEDENMFIHDRIYRVIDANLNRASEGLRVLEDVVRFFMDEENLTRRLKNLRHLVLKEIDNLPEKEKLIASRASLQDVGAKLKEKPRGKIEELIQANFKRVQEAQRSLEEYGKLILPSWGERFRELRFQTYSLEKQVKMKLKKRVDYTLYAVTESSLQEDELFFKVVQAVKGGITVLQLREKNLSSRQFLNRAINIKKIIPPHIAFIINDRIDVALACGADGVHLGQEDIPLSSARKILGEDKIIGVSTHNVEQAVRAGAEGADYIGVGPVFSTSTKPDALEPLGCEMVSHINREVKIPVVAIGGISPQNIKDVLETGVEGIAVVSSIFLKEDISGATQRLLNIIREFKRSRS